MPWPEHSIRAILRHYNGPVDLHQRDSRQLSLHVLLAPMVSRVGREEMDHEVGQSKGHPSKGHQHETFDDEPEDGPQEIPIVYLSHPGDKKTEHSGDSGLIHEISLLQVSVVHFSSSSYEHEE